MLFTIFQLLILETLKRESESKSRVTVMSVLYKWSEYEYEFSTQISLW